MGKLIAIGQVTISTLNDGKTGAQGNAGVDANLLDWVKDWNTSKTIIDSKSLITPKIFAGVRNSNNTLSGIALGNFDMKVTLANASVVTEQINGLVSLKNSIKTFHLDTNGNVQIGNNNQVIRYNSTTGKIEFGSDVSLNWINAINSAKNDAINTSIINIDNKISSLEIGGRNYLIGSSNIDSDKLKKYWSHYNGSEFVSAKDNEYNSVIKVVNENGFIKNHLSRYNPQNLYKKGDQWTISFLAKGKIDIVFSVRKTGTSGNITSNFAIASNSNVWQKISGTVTVTNPENFVITNSDVVINTKNTDALFTQFKWEKGNKPTDWTLAPEELEEGINNAQAVADAITKKANDEGWDKKLTYIDSQGIFTGTLSANTVNAIKINATQITSGTIDAARINVSALKSSLITAANIEALTLNVIKGKIGGWNIDSDSIYRGTKNNTSAGYTSASGGITIGSNGLRGFKWKLDSTGAGAIAGGNISWDTSGNVTFGSNVSLNWTNAANNALSSAKTYADTKKSEAISAAATDATNKVNTVQIGVRNYIQRSIFRNTPIESILNFQNISVVIDKSTLYNGYETIKVTQTLAGNENGTDNRVWFVASKICSPASFSFYVKASAYGTLRVRLGSVVDGNTTKSFPIDTSWKLIKIENFRPNATSVLFTSPNQGIVYHIAQPMLVEGTKAVDWSPSPQDIDSLANQAKVDAINQAAIEATNKLNSLKIGGSNLFPTKGLLNQTGGSTTGQNYPNGFSNNATRVRTNIFEVEPSTKYTISNPKGFSFAVIGYDNNKKGLYDTGWVSQVKEFTYSTAATAKFLVLIIRKTDNSNISISEVENARIKFEKGDKATDWTPCYSDMVSDIADAKLAGINAGQVADAITKKANDEKWATKLTHIDQNGIFTGQLSANTVTAIKINASQITAGVIDVARINVDSLKSSLITAANINALTLNVTKGKIGGWDIQSDHISIGALNTEGQTPIQIRSVTTGTSGQIFKGEIKPYGITMSWYKYLNAGHFILGQVMATGTTIKTGYVGLQMMSWDGHEYFCLSANSMKEGVKDFYNRIAGWSFDRDTIYSGTKNNTSAAFTSASGSISIGSNGIRGFKWRLDSTGAGALAGGNISWDASGNVTFASSVSLNWTNAANNALSSAKSYADIKKSEAINSAATDATNKMNQANVSGVIYCKGTGLNRNGNRYLSISGNVIYNSYGRGLHLTVIKRSDLSVISNKLYDVYGNANARILLTTDLNALNDTVIVIITSHDAIIIDSALSNAFIRCGGSGVILTYRNPYALIGIPGIGKGNGLERYGVLATEDEPYAEITTKVVNGIPQGISSLNGRALTLTDNTLNALGGSSYPKLTRIDSTGIYTGTLTANQITAGTIHTDRFAAGSINAAKLDAASIKSSIINTDYINGLSCTFVKGRIGGWNIGSDNITIGTLGIAGQTPIQIRSTSSGTSGQVYNGQIKPYGITLSWYQGSNAGHFIIGQVTAGGTSLKTGYIGIQMMAWDGTEYFCLSANSQKVGAKEVYNRIAGWAFDNDSIFRGTKNNTSAGYTSASGGITIGSNGIRGFKWRLDSTGAGAIAGGNISWDASGNVSFASNVSLNWTNAANNALASAKSYADSISIGGRNYVRNTSNNWSIAVTLNNTNNQCIFPYTVYTDGWIAGETITISFDYKYENIVKSANSNRIGFQGGGNVTNYDPAFGGINFINKIDFVAKNGIVRIIHSFIVTEAQLQNTHFGVTIRHDYLTGKVYIRNLKIERGTKPTDWSPAPEDISNKLTKITSTGIYTGTISASQINIDSSLVIGGQNNTGSIVVYDRSNLTLARIDENGIYAISGYIGGWKISNSYISGDTVTLWSDGTIENSNWWKLGKDGSGFVASGNVSWTSLGAVTITGTINATAGKIAGFDISGNTLKNSSSNASIKFDNLSGSSFLYINDNNALLSMRTDSARVGLAISTFATNAIGIQIIANSGSKFAIESYGPHQFGQRYGEKWNAPGVLFSGVFKNSTTRYYSWGNGLTISSVNKFNTGEYQVFHNLGHTNYTVVANPYYESGMSQHMNCYVRVEYILTGSFRLRVVNADNGGSVETGISFMVVGRNKW